MEAAAFSASLAAVTIEQRGQTTSCVRTDRSPLQPSTRASPCGRHPEPPQAGHPSAPTCCGCRHVHRCLRSSVRAPGSAADATHLRPGGRQCLVWGWTAGEAGHLLCSLVGTLPCDGHQRLALRAGLPFAFAGGDDSVRGTTMSRLPRGWHMLQSYTVRVQSTHTRPDGRETTRGLSDLRKATGLARAGSGPGRTPRPRGHCTRSRAGGSRLTGGRGPADAAHQHPWLLCFVRVCCNKRFQCSLSQQLPVLPFVLKRFPGWCSRFIRRR